MHHILRIPSTEEEWDDYHSIREQVLWRVRGRFGVYDRSHPDEHKRGNYPLLLMYHDRPIGVVRVDIEGDRAFFRRVAIREDMQGKGHGRVLLILAEQFATERGCTQIMSNVDRGAVEFYRKMGYSERGASVDGGSVPMQKAL